MKRRKAFNRLVTMIAVVAILLSSTTISVWSENTVSKAEGENGWFKSEDGRTLSVGDKWIWTDPKNPKNYWTNGSRDYAYLYLGKHDKEPSKFRILSMENLGNTIRTYAEGMVLDSDFLVQVTEVNDEFLKEFKEPEKDALIKVYAGGGKMLSGSRHLLVQYHTAGAWFYPERQESFLMDNPIVDYGMDAKIFPLSLSEIVYLYGAGTGRETPLFGKVNPPANINKGASYLPRSYIGYTRWDDAKKANVTVEPPILNLWKVHLVWGGVTTKLAGPACVVDHPAVVFAQLESGELDKPEAEYKLTLKDKNLDIRADKEVTVTGDSGSVPFDVSVGKESDGVSQVSVIMLDGEYKDGNPDKLNLKYHAKLADISAAGSGTGKLKLPANYDPSWKTYIVAEKRNGKHESDFASAPYEINLTVNDGFFATAFAAPRGVIIIAGTAIILIGVVFILGLSRRKKKVTAKTNDTPEE